MLSRSVALSGPMGVGKSTVGRALAQRVGLPFVDIDALIEHSAGRSVSAFFAQRGEAAFRTLEAETVARVLESGGPSVIALGGGAVTTTSTRRLLADTCTLVTLNADVSTLLGRVGRASRRPLLARAQDRAQVLASLVAARSEAYAEAHACIDVRSRSVEELAEAVERVCRRDPVLVPLGTRSYTVEVGAERLDELAPLLSRMGATSSSLLQVTDARVAPLVAEPMGQALGVLGSGRQVLLPEGEAQKTLAAVEQVWDAALTAGLDRKAVLLAIGGGVVGDIVGFAASTLLRGVRFVQVPTTLLAMVDASVGGKTAIDRPQGKNLVGAFHQPSGVIADTALLATLPDRDYCAGLAEIVKMALIADAALLEWLEAHTEALLARDPEAIRHAARTAIALKARVVAADEHETTGLRATLNFGHTVGHALEAESSYALRHGEAVALGMLAALRVGVAMSLSPVGLEERVCRLLEALRLPVNLDDQPLARALPLAFADKKRAGSQVGFVFCTEAGKAQVVPIPLAKLGPLLGVS